MARIVFPQLAPRAGPRDPSAGETLTMTALLVNETRTRDYQPIGPIHSRRSSPGPVSDRRSIYAGVATTTLTEQWFSRASWLRFPTCRRRSGCASQVSHAHCGSACRASFRYGTLADIFATPSGCQRFEATSCLFLASVSCLDLAVTTPEMVGIAFPCGLHVSAATTDSLRRAHSVHP